MSCIRSLARGLQRATPRMTLRRIDRGCVAHSPNVSRSLKGNHNEPPGRQGRAVGQAGLQLEGHGRQADQQAGRRRVYTRARHPHERHRGRRAALQAHHVRALSPGLARAAGAGAPRRAAPGDHGQLAARRPTIRRWKRPSATSRSPIEVTAAVAQLEPDPYLAQVYRFGLLEDFDHLYRYSALLDRLEGKDANNILQSYTDIVPGRPTVVEHRAPRGRSARAVRSQDGGAR